MKAAPLFTVIYEDENCIAVNKASGISTGGDRFDFSKERLDKIIENSVELPKKKVFTVHRIDRDTSGLVLFAKNEDAHRCFSILFEKREVMKRYIAVIHGRPPWQKISCELPLIPNGDKLHRTIVDKYRGKESKTDFVTLANAGNFTVVEALPQTGRTHQIRVHLAALGHPVVCDALYGKESPIMLSEIKRSWKGDVFEERPLLSRLGLHALEIQMPVSVSRPAKLKAPLARDLSALISQIWKIAAKKSENSEDFVNFVK